MQRFTSLFFAFIVASSAIMLACGSGPRDASTIEPWSALSDGEVTVVEATDLFSTLIAPIPGGKGMEDIPPRLATFAVIAMAGYWEQLTPNQREVIRSALAVPSTEVVQVDYDGGSAAAVAHALPVPISSSSALAAGDVTEECFRVSSRGDSNVESLNEAYQYLSARLGRRLEKPIVWVPSFFNSIEAGGSEQERNRRKDVAAATYGVDCDGDEWVLNTGSDYEACLVSAGPTLQLFDATERRALMVHELFHCFQLEVMEGMEATFGSSPAWVVEGAASWVELMFDPSSSPSKEAYSSYISFSNDLTTRDYDGIGVFAHLAHSGVDVWSLLLPLHGYLAITRGQEAGAILPTDSPKTERAIDWLIDRAAGTDFETTFASSVARHQDWGSAWDTVGRHVPDRSRESLRIGLDQLDAGPIELPGTRGNDPFLFEFEAPSDEQRDGAGFDLPEEAIQAAFAESTWAERGFEFVWPCVYGGNLDSERRLCLSTGFWLPRKVEEGHVAYLRLLNEFHDSSFAVLLKQSQGLIVTVRVSYLYDSGRFIFGDVEREFRGPVTYEICLVEPCTCVGETAPPPNRLDATRAVPLELGPMAIAYTRWTPRTTWGGETDYPTGLPTGSRENPILERTCETDGVGGWIVAELLEVDRAPAEWLTSEEPSFTPIGAD